MVLPFLALPPGWGFITDSKGYVDVWFNAATHTIDVYLSNVGKANIHISNVYVNHSSQIFISPFNLELGEHGSLSIIYDWHSGDLYYVDIVTNRGTHIASQYRAP